MLILGIESTCDETGASVVKDGKVVLSNVIASSADLHARYGGVFPELACRRHIDAILPVIEEALAKAGVRGEELDAIAVARGPGLVGALLIGLNAAKGLAIAWNKPLIGVNHVEAHLYASMMDLESVPLPALGVVLSGGHTLLLRIDAVGSYQMLATTVDDAIGEAFDKVAALLGFPYPGGPHVEKLAKEGNPKAFSLSAGKVKRSPLDFSFSGLKTAVMYATKEKAEWNKSDLAAAFQETALKDVAKKAKLAIESFPCKAIFFGGGVCNNLRLREIFKEQFPDLPLFFPTREMTTDNAAMIAALGAHKFSLEGDSLDLEALPRIPF